MATIERPLHIDQRCLAGPGVSFPPRFGLQGSIVAVRLTEGRYEANLKRNYFSPLRFLDKWRKKEQKERHRRYCWSRKAKGQISHLAFSFLVLYIATASCT